MDLDTPTTPPHSRAEQQKAEQAKAEKLKVKQQKGEQLKAPLEEVPILALSATAMPPTTTDSEPTTAQTTETLPTSAATSVTPKRSAATLAVEQAESNGKKIITPQDAALLQSAESLKPVSERDIGPGSFVARVMAAAARNVRAGLVDGGNGAAKREGRAENENENEKENENENENDSDTTAAEGVKGTEGRGSSAWEDAGIAGKRTVSGACEKGGKRVVSAASEKEGRKFGAEIVNVHGSA